MDSKVTGQQGSQMDLLPLPLPFLIPGSNGTCGPVALVPQLALSQRLKDKSLTSDT